jgi:prickle
VRRPNCLSPATHVRLAADVYRYSTSDDDSGCVLDEYSWLPSGLKPDDVSLQTDFTNIFLFQVHSYFAALPNDKVPFVNSVGDRWRLNQLKYQLPTQDYEPSASLSEAERQELKNFEFARKRECLGRGQIQRLPYDNSRRYCHQVCHFSP